MAYQIQPHTFGRHAMTREMSGSCATTLDPGDVQWNGIGLERVLGCVVYPAAEVAEPGVIVII
jgi:2-dehydropantoate 2-reductase